MKITKTNKKRYKNNLQENKEQKIEKKLWKKKKLDEQIKLHKEIQKNETIKICNSRYRDFDPE